MGTYEHKQEAPEQVRCMVITVSDTRTAAQDKSGKFIQEQLEGEGHLVIDYRIVKDNDNRIQFLLQKAGADAAIDAVLLNGGTGIAKRDTTYEAVHGLLDKEMPGFGEMFRYLSFVEDIGTAAILSRAVAGVYKDTAVFSMPGSSGAVRLALNRLILPELGHVIREIQKDL
ncbi:MogA/MoaB family molybdenum cofactor biosynthesis protein [Salibacterium halotolerans]|uniref:Molybdenum cofactor biosynthesis protein B n=1 Tax=Salibacterium halotolerans TaxID=1884432 RepID=A0A1I5W7W4_9BACI|nr:molybdenum cofactor biosynthesis protein B [Salibacterium halotolerans]SFQ15864.1 molybdenum cofactor biosynthesis protein B [Salibacterium halotolerans]